MIISNDNKLYTSHGTVISIDYSGILIHRHGEAHELVAYFFENAQYILLESTSGKEFSLLSNGKKSRSHLVKFQKLSEKEFAIIDPWTRSFLCARRLTSDVQSHKMEPRSGVDAWELFHVKEVVRPPEIFKKIESILINGTITAQNIVDLINDTHLSDKNHVISTLLPLVKISEMDLLGRILIEDTALISKVAKIFKDDIWFFMTLKNLKKSYDKVDGNDAIVRKREIKQGLDFLGQTGKKGFCETSGFVLNTYARRAVVPRRKACLVATVRNEGIYLLEWVAYHRALGFEEIFIYSNDNSDCSDELLEAMADNGLIVWINNISHPNIDVQGKAYSHALTTLPEILDYEWVAILDSDEFLCLNRDIFTGLDDFLSWHSLRDIGAIAVNWAYFCSSGAANWRDAPITERLLFKKPTVNGHIKTIFRPQKASSSQPHFPRYDMRTEQVFRGANANLHTSHKTNIKAAKAIADNPSDTHAYIAHYFFRSCEEFLWKFSRNRGDYKVSKGDITIALETRFLKAFLLEFNSGVKTNQISERNPAFIDELARLSIIPQISSANQAVKSAFRERSKRVIFAYREVLPKKWGEDGRRFLALLDQESNS